MTGGMIEYDNAGASYLWSAKIVLMNNDGGRSYCRYDMFYIAFSFLAMAHLIQDGADNFCSP